MIIYIINNHNAEPDATSVRRCESTEKISAAVLSTWCGHPALRCGNFKYGIDFGTVKTVPYTAKIPYPSDCFERMYGYLMIPTPSKLRGLKDIEFVHFSSL